MLTEIFYRQLTVLLFVFLSTNSITLYYILLHYITCVVTEWLRSWVMLQRKGYFFFSQRHQNTSICPKFFTCFDVPFSTKLPVLTCIFLNEFRKVTCFNVLFSTKSEKLPVLMYLSQQNSKSYLF